MSLSASSLPPVEEMLHGVRVSDPYRWLEDRSLPETEQWIEEQRVRFETYFSSCTSLDQLQHRVRHLLNVEVADQPVRAGALYFYRRRNPDQEQACIYVREAVTGRERLLVDPSAQGPFTSVGIYRVSEDASLLAYEVKHGGGDAKEIRILDVQSGETLSDRIELGYARGFTFSAGNDGFYYCQESATDTRDHAIRFHLLSAPVEDRAVLTRPHSPESRLILVSDIAHLGAIWFHEYAGELTGDFSIAPRERDGDWHAVFINKRLPYNPILHRGRVFVTSYEGCPNGQLIELALDGRVARVIVPEGHTVPSQTVIAGNRVFISYLRNGRSSIRSWTLEGVELGEIDVPGNGTIHILPRHGSVVDSFFYAHEAFTQPARIYECAAGTGKSSPLIRCAPPRSQNSCEVRELSFSANDGAAIPITLVALNPAALCRMQPIIMTSYGGFGVATTPQYSAFVTIMLELGAVFALPHIRGGGEFGTSWHDAGRAHNRQTAIDDFIAAAEWLSAQGVTCPSKLAIFGGSNSGLLVAAAMTQRPDLFGAVLCIAPLLDMVRYERFDQAVRWRREYGSVENAEEFHALYAYSPYHHVRINADYPATLFVCGDRDDRCNPAHVRKMAARLQERAAQCNSILVDYSTERGHSPVLPLSVRIDALARRLAFLCKQVGIEIPTEVGDETADY